MQQKYWAKYKIRNKNLENFSELVRGAVVYIKVAILEADLQQPYKTVQTSSATLHRQLCCCSLFLLPQAFRNAAAAAVLIDFISALFIVVILFPLPLIFYCH